MRRVVVFILKTMANFLTSNLVKAQSRLSKEFTAHEMREKVLPSLQIGLKGSNVLLGNTFEELRKREDRPVSGYFMKRITSATGAARTYNHTGSHGDSVELPFTWTTISQTFSTSLKNMDTNIFGIEEAIYQGMKNCVLDIHAQIETSGIAYLQTNKTAVVSSINSGNPPGNYVTWNAGNQTYEISADVKQQFVQYADVAMKFNKYNMKNFDFIMDTKSFPQAEFWKSQGAGNFQNTAFQFAGNDIYPSIELTDSNYVNGGLALCMPKGGFAMIPWIPKQNRLGVGDYNDYNGGFGSFIDPFTNPDGVYTGGLVFAVHGYALRADNSSNNSVQQDLQMEFEVSVDIAMATSPLSNSNETVIYQFAQM